MEFSVYSVRDVLVGFGPLIVEQNDQIAIRHFSSLASVPNVSFGDFELYRVGTFDTKNGLIGGLIVPELVSRGSDILFNLKQEASFDETGKVE